MKSNIIIAGLGGQGVVFITRLLANTAVRLGRRVTVSETHGMSQRGGSVISHLKIDGSEAPLIQRGTADCLLALHPQEALRSLTFLRAGAAAFVNAETGFAPEVMEHLDRLDISVAHLPAGRLAVELDAPAVANVILVGFAISHPALPLPYQALVETLTALATPARRQDRNLRAIEAGYGAGQMSLAKALELRPEGTA